MISPGSATRIYLAAGPTDMRRGFDGLAEMVRERLKGDALSGHWYVFCNRRKNRIKVLYSDGSGLWLCTKKLGRGSFSWPATDSAAVVHLSPEELALLVGGIELERSRMKDWWRKAV